MSQNLDSTDRILRFALAVWLLGSPWAPVVESDLGNGILTLVGVIALVESLIGWCALMSLVRRKSR